MLLKKGQILSDKDLVNTAMNQLYRLISGPLMLLFIPLYLTQIEQGYWYTFSSIAALAVFADLGFSNIILQFAAYEFAFLKFNSDGTISGDEIHLRKLADFFRFSVKWLVKVTLIVFPIIVIAGYFFIDQKTAENIKWVLPWFIYSISSALVFVNSSLLSFFEGCNSVAKVQGIRFKITVLTSITVLIGLFFEKKLFALALSLLVSAFAGSFLIYQNYRISIIQLWNLSAVKFYSWKQEFFSLIWRYALSWSSGYFIFQLFVPLSFQYYGTIEAGRIGFGISTWAAISSIANIWLISKVPAINILISKKAWDDTVNMLKNIFIKSALTYTVIGCMLLLCCFEFKEKIFLFKRLPIEFIMCILYICNFLQLIINLLATYLRAHKKEPMVWCSVLQAIFVAISTYYIVNNYSIDYLFVGFLISSVLVLIFTLYITYLQNKYDRRSF